MCLTVATSSTLDLLVDEVGIRRGRRDVESRRVGDTVDCGCVETHVPMGQLRISSEMSSPRAAGTGSNPHPGCLRRYIARHRVSRDRRCISKPYCPKSRSPSCRYLLLVVRNNWSLRTNRLRPTLLRRASEVRRNPRFFTSTTGNLKVLKPLLSCRGLFHCAATVNGKPTQA